MKKKILLVGRSLGVGGIEKALGDFIDSIDRESYDVSLLLFTDKESAKNIDVSRTQIIDPPKLLSYLAVTNLYAKRHLGCFLIRSFFAMLCKIFGSYKIYNLIFKFSHEIGPFDIAISYFHDQTLNGLYYGTNLYVLNKVISTKKIAWIHSDYSGTGLNCKERDDMYKKFDAVVNVSKAMKSKFDALGIIPSSKSFLVYNQINNQNIIKLSNQTKYTRNKRFYIVSVCRLDILKSPLELCKIANKLKNEGLDFQWHIIGDGPLRGECMSYINNELLGDYVYFHGLVKNPFPIVKSADLFVSGSVSETFGLSIYEALLLGTPVVAYKYDAVAELIGSNNGLVVESFEELFSVVKQLIINQDEYKSLRDNTRLIFDYNKESSKQFKTMIDKVL